MQKRDCPFCGAVGVEIDLEHALPDWLRELILKRKDTPEQRLTLHVGGERPRTFLTRNANITVHAPCKEYCNNGWMSKLEGRAKPMLRPFVEADPPIAVPIGEQQCAELAFWLLKTAMVWDFIDPMVPYFTNAQRRAVVEHRIDVPLMMWIGRYTGAEGHFMAMHMPIKLQSGGLTMEGFAFTMMAGHLVTQFLTFRQPPSIGPVSIIVPGTPPSELVSLWPPRQFVWPPPRTISTAEWLLAIATRFDPAGDKS